MRVIICWTEISGYTAACWRELAAQSEIELCILAWPSNFSRSGTKFERTLMDGLPLRFLEDHEQQNSELVERLVTQHKPDLLLMGGWAEKPYRDLVWNKSLDNCRLVLAMDTPWRGTFRQRFARLKIGRYIDRLDAIFVPGQRGSLYAKHLGMTDDRIFTGMYGFDYKLFEPTLDRRAAQPWPKRFIYLGRYAISKGLDVLAAGYSSYRKSVPDPWPLACFGSGPMRHLLEHCEGIEINDWVQPPDQTEVLQQHGVSVLASRTEPWAIAVAEAMGSGLPAICTDAVGAAPDLIRPEQNGLIVPANNPAAIASAMKWMHDRYDRLPAMGQAAKQAAAPYAAQNWAKRFDEMARKLCNMPPRR